MNFIDVSRWWPNLNVEDLLPGYSIIRPKLSIPGDTLKTF